MKAAVTNLNGFLSGLQLEKTRPEKILRKKIEPAIRMLHKQVTLRTPVHTGKSLRNWVWSNTDGGQPVREALGSGPTGRTSNMSLGSEPRRSANQSAVNSSFASMDMKNIFSKFIMSNSSENIMRLEYGELPSKEKSRSPAGMARISYEEMLQFLR